jgi:HK97 family phage prohead protease
MKNHDASLKQISERGEAAWDKPGDGWVKFYVDHPFDRRVAENEKSFSTGRKEFTVSKGDIQTSGYASTWVKDRDEEYVHPAAFDETLEPFLGKNPMMLWQHNPDWPLGTYTDAAIDQWGLRSEGLIRKVEDREPDWKHLAYHSVAKGVVRTHSIGGYFERDYDGERLWIKKVHLMEVSIVSIPANPESIFEAAVKAATDTSRRPSLTQKHIQQMMQLLGAAEMTDPELLAMNEQQRVKRYEEIAAYYVKCGKNPPEYEEWNELVKESVTSSGLAGIRPVATRTIAFMRRVQGVAPPTDDDIKRGRKLSAKNEDRIRGAMNLLGEVLEEVDEMEDEEVFDGEAT